MHSRIRKSFFSYDFPGQSQLSVSVIKFRAHGPGPGRTDIYLFMLNFKVSFFMHLE